MTEIDQEKLKSWIGKTEQTEDLIDVGQARRMQATLDQAPTLKAGDALPSLWHWIYFPTEAPLGKLGREGHPEVGDFMPPVPLPRRMWAGGRFQFHRPLFLDERARKISTVKAVNIKSGRTGPLCFVTVQHQMYAGDEHCFTEEHDIVYREDPAPDAKTPPPVVPPEDAEWQREVIPTAVMLFRYSALTFNGHRIHYDRDYCRDVEGYPGLVFHGPLSGTLLINFAEEKNPGRTVAHYSFRAVSPMFDTSPVVLAGKTTPQGVELWAHPAGGGIGVSAELTFDALRP